MSISEEKAMIREEMLALDGLVTAVDRRIALMNAMLRDTSLNDAELEVIMRVRFGVDEDEEWP